MPRVLEMLKYHLIKDLFDIFLEIIGDEKLFETVIGIALRETRFALLLGPFMPKSLASS